MIPQIRKNIASVISPVLVESSLALVTEMFSPDSLEGTETGWGLDVPHKTDNDHGRCFKDGDGFNYFLFVHLCTMKNKQNIYMSGLLEL